MKKVLSGLICALLLSFMISCNPKAEANDMSDESTTPSLELTNMDEDEDKKEQTELEKTEDMKKIEDIEYKTDAYTFTHPSNLTKESTSTEDASITVFEEEDFKFYISQGEAWIVDLDHKEEDYMERLGESYNNLKIKAITQVKLDGHDGVKLEASYEKDGLNYTNIRYFTIVNPSSFTFSFDFLESKTATYTEIIEKITSTLNFIK